MTPQEEADAIQRILRDLVEREVIYNVSNLIYELGKVSGELPYSQDSDINDENLRELMVCPATYLEAAENSGYSIVEHGGEYYWYEQGDPVPFKDLPSGTEVRARKRRKGNPGWAWQDFMGNWSIGYPTRAEAIVAAWVDTIGANCFDSAEEAAEDCCTENDIDRHQHDHEVYEHWIVTGHFGRRLQEHGEHVVEFCNMTIWCRCCTGQSICMDGVIENIARLMEILPGMANDWSKKD